MTPLPRPRVMLDILVEHLEELDFLWEQRERVLFAPDWTLQELAELEERAEAHLDGLRIGAGHSADIARPALAGEEKGAAAAAAMTLMALGAQELEEGTVTALAVAASDAARDGIRIGLRHSDVRRVAGKLTQMASAGEPPVRAAAADVLAFHRLAAPPKLADLLGAADPSVKRIVYGAAGRFGGPWSLDIVEKALAGDDAGLRDAALEASARLGLPRLAAVCRQAASRRPPVLEAVRFLGVLGEPQDLQILEALAAQPGGLAAARAALEGLGSMGHVRAIPVLLKAMTDAKVAHAAGAAFVRITGAEKIAADEALPPPPDLPEDEADFWDDTKPPDPTRASAWWQKEKGRFAPAGRWQSGHDVSKTSLGETFALLPLQTRRDLYLGVRAKEGVKAPDLELERKAALQTSRG
jgi:uncharacterized protein (TIGR02270 family)